MLITQLQDQQVHGVIKFTWGETGFYLLPIFIVQGIPICPVEIGIQVFIINDLPEFLENRQLIRRGGHRRMRRSIS